MRSLFFKEAKKLLLKYNIPLCATEIVNSKKDAIKIAKDFKYPIVIKISSPDILHKTEGGFVKKDIKDQKELEVAWNKIIRLANKKKVKIEGVLVQKQLSGREIIIGIKRDAQFGPILMFGLGGVFVEVLKDVSFAITPIKREDAFRMMKEIKGIKILKGFRGKKPVNLEKIANILVSLSQLSLKEKGILEIDLNPVIVNEKGAWVVDARFLMQK